MNRGSVVWLGLTMCVALVALVGCKPTQTSTAEGTPSAPAVNTTNADTATSEPATAATESAAPPADAKPTDTAAPEAKAANSEPSAAEPAAAAPPAASSSAASGTGVKLEGGTATINADNSKISFVGTHKAPKKPDPRTGYFTQFSGKLVVDEASKTLKSAEVDIETASLRTQFDKLTDHLKSPDFFEVREYPKAAFVSTKIEAGDGANQVKVEGKLTLHGVTKDITFPATVQIDGGAITVTAKFDFNRTDYGMSLLTDSVDDKVSINAVVGEPTPK
jgi:polyisoprenoid-binding protein YceI